MKIAIVDDEQDMRQSISQWLSLSGFETETYASGEDALKGIGADYPGVVVTDVKMPGMDGVTLLKRLMAQDSGLPVILITGHGDVPMAVEAMRIGAYDFLEKPFNPDRMTELAKRASTQRRLTLDNRALRRELSDGKVLMKKLIGSSPEMERLREDILDLGQADSHVLIDGETGTGKTLVAHALHAVGPRAAKKLITISCSAYDEADLAARLFGPAPDEGLPLVEEARGGTLCLEDIEALPNALQSRLLTFINEQETPPQTRILAICNQHAQGQTLEDVLRPDLFFRLSAMTIVCPPLRARGEDILTLFNRMSEQFAEEYGCDAPQVTAQEAAQLLQAPWPGNVRQLVNIAERAVLQNRRGSGSITSLLMADNEATGPTITTEGKPLKEYVEAFERMLIDNTMRRHKGSISAVMEELCLPRRTLNEKMAKYGLSRSDYL
ncbi:C4-dicarboxylate transport transcriptional regulatory protein DctD [Roseibacterium elongatum DSM 19469]|uniref:C4-dicarboxylate transport transcriptional regulatory protein DctD n=1 Tax=Roseicyclus elongatus DSM 19469 TaxID=1294273 RepID=W8RUM8_9RHOB|nr:sigma-54 dependent transcriptional regulator [Roseibacterium elongatum]AHM04899.1 C4-dicarboxylate transport transcriptional regulatory protein DctD [Roseibacterium elongatum DSM 19469]